MSTVPFLRATAGALKWGSAVAAEIADIVVGQDDEGACSAVGRVVSVDVFRVSQAPLSFVAYCGDGRCEWAVGAWDIAGARITVALGEMR